MDKPKNNPLQHSSRHTDVLLQPNSKGSLQRRRLCLRPLPALVPPGGREFSWYQIERNYGEVFFAFSASMIPLFFPRSYATALLLAMAISDDVTGVVRHFYFRRHGFNVKLRKHWTGSVAYLLTAIIIAFLLLNAGTIGKIGWATTLALAEYQPWLDDNLAVPLVGSLLFLLY